MKNFEKFISKNRDGRWIKNYVCASSKACEKCPLNKVNCGSDHKVLEWANTEAETTEESNLNRYKIYTYTGEQVVINSAKLEFICDSFKYIKDVIFKDKYDRKIAHFNYSNICGFVRF